MDRQDLYVAACEAAGLQPRFRDDDARPARRRILAACR